MSLQQVIDELWAMVDGYQQREGRLRQAISLLRSIDEPTGPAAKQVGNDPTPIPARKVRATPIPVGPRPKRAQQAQQPAVCDDCGASFKSRAGLGAHRYHRHNKTGPVPAALPDRHLAPVPPLPPLGRCTCGKDIADADSWGRHNQTVSNPASHRLVRTEAS